MPASTKTRAKSSRPVTRSAQTRDAELTRTTILDAAEEEFAQNGLAGARTDAIAAKTGVTKAMIYYYFASKEALYEAVLERAFAGKIKSIRLVVSEMQAPEDALRDAVEIFLLHAGRNPNIPGILIHEAMQNKGKYYKQVGFMALYEGLAEILSSGIECGVFRQLEPLHTAVNIVGLLAFYFSAHENLKHLWPGKTMLSPAMLEQHKQEAVRFVMAGVSRNDS